MSNDINDMISDDLSNTSLKLYFTQNEYTGGWHVTDENYEYATDTGASPSGSGATKCYALLSYFHNVGFDADMGYELIED